ncbi:efflux RND transporter periplasmic adaptor subunit [Paenibacillus senegalensis]|uniref:efflux RND transporter periplasmic adaptor subunit n=1 Tax=Paenibacillus senegalensis TaxID=1465766 RepID=UPI000289E2E7|nr:efflux RND transporter periplasmic adaptor subunit [Paenibacillus senegalensis]
MLKHRRMPTKISIYKAITAVILSSAILAGCTAPAPEAESANPEGQVKKVRIQEVGKLPIGQPLEQVADLVPSLQMGVFAKANGDVTQLLKQRGDYVSEGEVIARLDSSDVLLQRQKGELGIKASEAQLSQARQDYNNGLTELRNSISKMESAIDEIQKNYNKMRNNYDLGLVTQFEVEQMETQLNNQLKDLEILQQQLQTMESTNPLAALEVQLETSRLSIQEIDRNLQYYEIKAPLSGYLTQLPIVENMTLSPGTQVGQIEQLNPIKLVANLSEEAAEYLRGKEQVSFRVPGIEEIQTGTVTYLAEVMDTTTRTFELNVEAANDEGLLRPGTRTYIQLSGEEEREVIAVPTSSIVREGPDTFVFVLVGDTAEKRQVQLGRLNGLDQEIVSGLNAGESLIVSGQHQLTDQEKVELQP